MKFRDTTFLMGINDILNFNVLRQSLRNIPINFLQCDLKLYIRTYDKVRLE